MKQSERAWLAGIFEGEGSVSINNRHRGEGRGWIRIVLQVRMNDRDVLDRFCELVGFGKVYGPYQASKAHQNPHYCWNAGGIENVVALFDLIEPWLLARRTEQFRSSIKRYEKRYRRCAKCSDKRFQCESCYLKATT